MTRMLGRGFWRVQTERGGDQRRELLDVGAHHDDVPRLQRGIVGEQSDEHLAQHFDLAIGPVACVELHASVGRLEHRQLVLWERRAILSHIGLQPPEQGCRPGGLERAVVQICRVRTGGDEGELKFSDVAAEVGEQPMINECFGGGAVASRWPARLQTVGLRCGFDAIP